jgi:enoyl-CoA hydratase/carnithine racemase
MSESRPAVKGSDGGPGSARASGKLVIDEPVEGVVRLRISNPDKRGALDHEILDAITASVGEQESRCLVITGDGPVFSAGYDIGNFNDESAFSEAAEKLVAHPFTDAIDAIEAYRYPVIAAINGHAIGGGLEMAVTCDIRIAARGARMGMPPAKIGLVYGHTGLRRFMEVCGLANTNELFYSGRNVDADRAYDMGLVNQVVDADDLEETVLSIAGEIARNSPLSLAGNKRILRTLRAMPGTLPEDVEAELVELRESCFYTEDFREGITAFGEKRQPQWKGR